MSLRRILAAGLLLSLTGLRPAVAAENLACVQADPKLSPVTQEPWTQARLGVSGLASAFQGWGTKIAVIGSGVSNTHPQLTGNTLAGSTIGFTGNAATDCYGIGTAIAGAASAAPVSGSTLRGLAPQAVIIPIKLSDAIFKSETVSEKDFPLVTTQLIAALDSAVARDPDVIVLPPFTLPGTTQLRDAITKADQSGALLIQGIPAKFELNSAYPLAYPEVLGVLAEGADTKPSATDTPTQFIDLIAPGVNALVLSPGGGVRPVSASYVAAGYVAGAAALVVEVRENISPADLRKVLIAAGTAQPILGSRPALNPAAALGPIPQAAVPEVKDSLGLLQPPTDSSSDLAAAAAWTVAIGSILALIMAGWLAAASIRGRRRHWKPAEHGKEFVPPPYPKFFRPRKTVQHPPAAHNHGGQS